MIWYFGWLVAVLLLFRSALQWLDFATQRRSTAARVAIVVGLLGAASVIAMLANGALTRHDMHFDFTVEKIFTPDPMALEVIKELTKSVRLTYFYRHDDPLGRRAKKIIELMAKESALLEVVTVDPDKDPSVAQTSGIKFYNAALLETDDRQVIVRSTDENEIALGVQKLLREYVITVCFMSGHGEYPSDNYEFHTHTEELSNSHADHSHGAESAVVRTTGHGVGRFKRSLQALGYETKIVVPAIDGTIDSTCRVVVDAGPQTQYSDLDTQALYRYLQRGGAALLLYDLEFAVQPHLANALAEVGVRVSNTVVVDDKQHYAADPEMVAVTHYEEHPATARLSFSFFPGVRALSVTKSGQHISTRPLFSSSANSVGHPIRRIIDDSNLHHHAHPHSGRDQMSQESTNASHVLAVASAGMISDTQSHEFKLIVVGDSDFISNSFYPYMSNNRLALGMVRWLAGEGDRVPVAARIPAPSIVEFTIDQQRAILLLLVVALPSVLAFIGMLVWWKRHRT